MRMMLLSLPGTAVMTFYSTFAWIDQRLWWMTFRNVFGSVLQLIVIFVLIDSRHPPQKIDLEFVNTLGKWEIPFCLVFTKADKENQRTVSRNVKDFLDRMRASWQFLPQHFVTSTIKKMGRDKILDLIDEGNKEFEEAKERGGTIP